MLWLWKPLAVAPPRFTHRAMPTVRATGAAALALSLPLVLLLASRWWQRRGSIRRRGGEARQPGADTADDAAAAAPPPAAAARSNSTASSTKGDDSFRFKPHPKMSVEHAIEEITSALDACGDVHIVDDADRFELVEVLGQGSFGAAELRRVPRSDGSSDGSFIVIKRVPLNALSGWTLGALVGEVNNGAKLRHRFMVRQYGAYLSRRSELCMVLQYAAGGTLWDTMNFQREGKRGSFPTEFVTTWLSQLCSAVQYMHENRVLHRDISTENIFLSFYGALTSGGAADAPRAGGGAHAHACARVSGHQRSFGAALPLPPPLNRSRFLCACCLAQARSSSATWASPSS